MSDSPPLRARPLQFDPELTAEPVFFVAGVTLGYVPGDLRQVSKHMLVWTQRPPLPEAADYRRTNVPFDIERKSGWPKKAIKDLFVKGAGHRANDD